jgi:DNA repair exonuclease SbcCD nuclease subunit
MIRILLTSDIHLGMGEEEIPVPFETRIATFKKICALAGEHDIFLIAGDLFHDSPLARELTGYVSAEFEALRDKGVEVVYTPGDHEITESGAPAPHLYRTNASHIFSGTGEPEAYTVRIGEELLFVYGFPATSTNDIVRARKNSEEGFHVGLFHADFSLGEVQERSRVYVLKKNDIKSLNLDFYALGHHHFFKLFKFQNRLIGAYPGSPEAVSFNETGDRYVLSISVDNNEICQIKRLTVNSLRLKDSALDCERILTSSELAGTLLQERSEKTVLRAVLTGERRFKLGENFADELSREFHRLIFIDRSFPTLDLLMDEFAGENSLRGEFFSCLKEKISVKDVPADVDLKDVARVLNSVSREGHYSPEDWTCE